VGQLTGNVIDGLLVWSKCRKKTEAIEPAINLVERALNIDEKIYLPVCEDLQQQTSEFML